MIGSAVSGLAPVLKVKLLAKPVPSEDMSGTGKRSCGCSLDAVAWPGAGAWSKCAVTNGLSVEPVLPNGFGVEAVLANGFGVEAVLANGLGNEAVLANKFGVEAVLANGLGDEAILWTRSE